METARVPIPPEKITQAQAMKACQALGLDPNTVHTIYLEPLQASVEMIAHRTGPDGRPTGTPHCTFTVRIPIERIPIKRTTKEN